MNTTYEFYTTNDQKRFKHLKHILIDRFEVLEDELSSGTYFNGSKFSMIDAVFGPVFRYHRRIAEYKDYGLFDEAKEVKAWGDRLLERPSVISSVPESYRQDMTNYLKTLESVFTTEVKDQLQ